MITREKYLADLQCWKDKDVIKVITGVRRCGKSTLMEQWKAHLRTSGIGAERIIHINLEMMENEPLLEYHALHDAVLSQCAGDAMHYVLLDEVQNVPDFQKAIDSLYVRPNIDLYITGSNAQLLSGTLATLLSGRYVEIKMLPFSFSEYAETHKGEASQTRLWSDFLHDGSFPAIMQLGGNDDLAFDYLDGVLNTILVKDVAQRVGGNAPALRRLSAFLYDNIGNLASPSSIAKAMTAGGHSISAPTVSRYLEALEAAFLVYPVDRYDVRGKRILKQEKKYYAVDMGLRRVLCSNGVRDTGRILENLVFLELLRREKNVYVGQGPTGEIDFVTNGPAGVKYWQVSETTAHEETLQRELSSFESVRDNYPKTLLTLDDAREQSYDGIRRIYALDWLLGKVEA
ncbi:ATP-binding protein [uncultured Senegalimassilia sp.]|uniref:ATP-binding protein n=1 Tax=uncultured Senegalimassilia sp. TaxID=1714350 RepID=UPI0025E9D8C7|nr:ATP-binding protein [uncultured Senegalimassilia sp.]